MQPNTKAMDRLEEWLKEVRLPEMAKNCIENFVCSFEQAKEGDMLNFVYIDIVHFSPPVQEKLIEGFIYSYFGLRPAFCIPKNMPGYYKAGLN